MDLWEADMRTHECSSPSARADGFVSESHHGRYLKYEKQKMSFVMRNLEKPRETTGSQKNCERADGF